MKTSRFQWVSMLSIIGLLALALGIAVFITLKNTADLQDILIESVKSQLISTSIAAREILDVERFARYNSQADIEADAAAYAATLADLRSLQAQVGAEYIYALKQLDGLYYFVFDTDTEDTEVFIEYPLSPVHELAFLGLESADVMNVEDEYGTFNTGAVPIWKDGEIIGIISTDTEDAFIARSARAATVNAVALTLSMAGAMAVIVATMVFLLRRIDKMQRKLYHMANFDVITGLPNRQYLLEYLTKITAPSQKPAMPFALFFVDLDNFKRVNDHAGHDAGDELLRHIAQYLGTIHDNSKAFRPSAGILNISARVGGDEFIQLVPGIETEAEAELAAQKMIDNFGSQTLSRFVEKYQVGLSVGVALFPYHTTNFNVLIKYADIAMYHAKRAGKNTYCVYRDGLGHILASPKT